MAIAKYKKSERPVLPLDGGLVGTVEHASSVGLLPPLLHGLRTQHRLLTLACRSVGYLKKKGGEGPSVLGTCWMIDGGVIVTNRHVIEPWLDADELWHGKETRFRADFGWLQHDWEETESVQLGVRGILGYGAKDAGTEDYAFLEVADGDSSARGTIPPIACEKTAPGEGESRVAAIGFPGALPKLWTKEKLGDSARSMAIKLIEPLHEKKLSPGLCEPDEGGLLYHDCSTTWGSSGSVLVSLDTGKAVGLHSSGWFTGGSPHRAGNHAIAIQEVLDALATART